MAKKTEKITEPLRLSESAPGNGDKNGYQIKNRSLQSFHGKARDRRRMDIVARKSPLPLGIRKSRRTHLHHRRKSVSLRRFPLCGERAPSLQRLVRGDRAEGCLSLIHICAVELLVSRPKDFSFPSGHTIASFEFATVLFLRERKAGIIALVAAVLISFSRMSFYLHFPSDVFTSVVR